MVGSANNKARTLRMGNANGRKFTEKKKKKKKKKVEEIPLANLARASQAKIDCHCYNFNPRPLQWVSQE